MSIVGVRQNVISTKAAYSINLLGYAMYVNARVLEALSLERRKYGVTIDTLSDIADQLEVSAADLLSDKFEA